MNRGDICKAFLSVFCVANICFLTACKDEDVVKSVDGRVPFRPVAGCEDGTRLNGTTWETGDQIGIYAYNSEGELASEVNANVRFLVNPQNNSCTAANADSTIWLSNDETYSVVAYYPYSTTYVQNITSAGADSHEGQTSVTPCYIINDWADQSDLTRLDLLWTSKSGITAYDSDVSLQFAHQFSRVQINFTIDTEASSLTADSLVGMKVKLSGKNFPTLFDLKTGELSFGPMNQDSISFNVTHEDNATTATAAAIVVPDADGSTSETRSITVLLPNDDNRTFKFDVPSEIAFEKGKFYVWNVTFNTDATLSTNSFYVSASGNDSNSGKKDSPLATIAGAIAKMDDMEADFTIFIDGKVTGSQTIASNFTLEKAKSVTIKGANGLDPTNHQPKDTLDGNRSGSVIKIESNVPVTFQNIMLINGRAQNGAGIYINDYSADVTVEDGTIIRDCLAEEKGGGIYAYGNLLVTGGVICKDTASYGAGIYVYQYGEHECTVSVGGSVEISENVADQNGGGICVDGYGGQPVLLSGSASITRNYSVNQGGGISLLSVSTLVMSGDAAITENDALNYGGGVFLDEDGDYGGAQLVMTGGTISTNRLIAGDAQGKGLYVTEGAAFTMGGAACVTSDNDVFLQGEANNAKIYIGSLLTADAPVATITIDEDMAANPTVLTLGQLYVDGNWVDATTTVAANYTKFAISGNTGAINQEGVYLAAINIDGVASQITSMTASGTVTISGYANKQADLLEAIKGALRTLHDERPSVLVKLDMSGVLGMTEVGENAFNQCSALQGIVIPEGVTKIGSDAFGMCTKLEEISIPSTLTYIGDGVFYDDISLTAIAIPSGIEYMGTEIFYSCSSLASVTLPEGLDSIGSWFEGCESLTSLTIPSTVTKLSNYAFGTCALTSCAIPSGVVKLPKDLFQSCESLVSVVLPAGITTIEQDAFWGCTSLSTIYYMGTEAQHAAMDIQDAIVSSSQVTWVYNYDPNGSGANQIPQGFAYVEGGYMAPHSWDCEWSPAEGYDDKMFVPNMYVCKHEVTQTEWEQFMTYYGVAVSGTEEGQSGSELPYRPNASDDKDNTPVYYISWAEAIAYCNLRSMAENLTPVYSLEIDGTKQTNPANWSAAGIVADGNGKYYSQDNVVGYNIPDNAYYWRSNYDYGNFYYDETASGYRLPNVTEWALIATQNSAEGSTLGIANNTTVDVYEYCRAYTGAYATDGDRYAMSSIESSEVDFSSDGLYYQARRNTNDNEHDKIGLRVVRAVASNGTPSYIGSKQPGATLSVGDVVFSDGSAESYSSLTDAQKSSAIAVIFYSGTECSNDGTARTLGVGLEQTSGLSWCSSTAYANSVSIDELKCNASGSPGAFTFDETADKNGSDNFNQITLYLLDNNNLLEINNEEEYYPAFYWARHYSTEALSSSELTSGWYMPTFAEMYYLSLNFTTVNNALAACDGTQFASSVKYWTSTQDSSKAANASTAMVANMGSLQIVQSNTEKDGSGGGTSFSICAIRQF